MTEETPKKTSVSRKPRASKTGARTTKTSQRTSKTSTRTSKTRAQTNKTSSKTTKTEGRASKADAQAAKTDSTPIEETPQRPIEDDIPIAEIIPEIDLDSAALDEFLAETPQEQRVAASVQPDPIIYNAEINDFPPLPPWPVIVLTVVVIALLM